MYIIDTFINKLNDLVILTNNDIRFTDLNQITSKILDNIINFEDINVFNKSMNELATYNIKIETINKLEDLLYIILITYNIKIIIDLLNIIEYKIKID